MTTKTGPYSKDDAPAAREQPFAGRGQSRGQDWDGPYSKEVPVPPREKQGAA